MGRMGRNEGRDSIKRKRFIHKQWGFFQSLWGHFSIEQNSLLHSEDFTITDHKIRFEIFKYLLEIIAGEELPS